MAKEVKADPITDAQRQYRAIAYELKRRKSRDSLADFIEFTMPDRNDPENPEKSRYILSDYHRLLCAKVEQVVFTCEGTIDETDLEPLFKFANSLAPQHGKSEIISRRAVAWMIGRNPHWHIIVGTYSGGLAKKIGSYVREIMRTERYRAVFPEAELKSGSESKDEMETTEGGSLYFAGRNKATTGMPADVFVIDDPYAGVSEAKSDTIQENVWDWYVGTADTRTHDMSGMLMIHTRWIEGDLIGLLADPNHPDALKDPAEAEKRREWEYINIPAILDEEACEVLAPYALPGEEPRKPGDALMPWKHGIKKLEARRRRDPIVFSAMYMGKPSPDDGTIFTTDMIQTYDSHDHRPPDEELTFYMAGDLAVTTNRRSDYSAVVIAGLDRNGTLWIVDGFLTKLTSEKLVERIIDLMIKWQPAKCSFEQGAIQRTIGPFLRRRMRERDTWHSIYEASASGTKEARATSIQAMMGSGRVRFPTFMSWWSDARDQMLKFPVAAHDDFVDAIAYLGMMIAKMYAPDDVADEAPSGPKVGTLAYIRSLMKKNQKPDTGKWDGY